jgi:DNA-3-methyladenine glycosylase
VARELLGKMLLRKLGGRWLGGWIVETEAYLSKGDLASHSARGQTAGNAAMFGPPGTLYVYPIHAKYCMNTVTESEGTGSAVLIRAIEPVWGIEQISELRGTDELRRLTRGPAMLCQALAVDRSLDGINLIESSEIVIARSTRGAFRISSTKRIGISQATDRKLRFIVDGNWFVSGRVSDHRSRPTR